MLVVPIGQGGHDFTSLDPMPTLLLQVAAWAGVDDEDFIGHFGDEMISFEGVLPGDAMDSTAEGRAKLDAA